MDFTQPDNANLVVAKYALPIDMSSETVKFADSFSMQLPTGAQPLAVDVVADAWILYVLVDPEAELEDRHFRLVQTGIHRLDGSEYLQHIGSFGSKDRKFVFHLFERISETVRPPRVGGGKIH